VGPILPALQAEREISPYISKHVIPLLGIYHNNIVRHEKECLHKLVFAELFEPGRTGGTD
jgi:hypothetical protein